MPPAIFPFHRSTVRDQRAPALPASGVLGPDLAREVIAWVTPRLSPFLAEAEAWLATQSSAPAACWFWPMTSVAQIDLQAGTKGIAVVSVIAGHGRTAAIARIGLDRNGSVAWWKHRGRVRRG
jgi:hypothetical protein